MPSLASPIDAGEPVFQAGASKNGRCFRVPEQIAGSASGACAGPGLASRSPEIPTEHKRCTSGSVPTVQTGESRYPRAATLRRSGVVAARLTRRRRAAVGTTHQGMASGPALRTDETTSRIA